MRKAFFCYLIFLLAPFACAVGSEPLPSSNRELIDLLDRELARRDSYIGQRIKTADSIKVLIDNEPERALDLYLELGSVVATLNCDSAIAVFNRGYDVARAAGDTVMAQRFRILSVSELRKFGATPDALDVLEQIAEIGIFPQNKLLYIEIARDLNLHIAEILGNSPLAKSYLSDGRRLAQEQLTLLPPESPDAQIVESIIYYTQGKRPLSAASLHSLTTELDVMDPNFSLAMTMLGGQYYFLDSYEESVRYLAMAAISDIRRGDLKGSALTRLGRALYAQGELLKAYKYLSVALENAVKASDMTNTVLVSDAMMPVSHDLSALSKRRMIIMVALIVVLSIAILLLANFYYLKKRRVREMERVKRDLACATHAREVYISEFINLCSDYMGCLDDFTRMCRRKIAAGQTDDLLKYMKDGKLMYEQRAKFDYIFDETFNAIYPGFVDGLNRLLLPEKQIILSSPNVLTTELRVLAFARLGLDDTAQVARVLGVSPNTIYTYRNKFRNMAIERETFDSDILNIGAIE